MSSEPKAAETPEAESLSGLLAKEKEALERGISTLDKCIAKVESMLEEGGEYDDRLASHLAWLIKGRADSVAKLRAFHEKVKTQSLELTPDQTMRAIAKFIQTSIPVTKRDYFRGLLDEPIDDIGLIQ